MAESFRRILERKNIKLRDLVMLKHENLELNLIKKYKYQEALDKFLKEMSGWMLQLELAGNMQDEAVYNYFPEQKEEYGTISIHKGTGEIEVKKISINDEHRSYLFHALNRIEKYTKENDFPERDIVAWY